MTPQIRVVLVTCPNTESAEKIAYTLVTESLAGCVNILPVHLSVYSWQGKIEKEPEALMIIKTTEKNVSELESKIYSIHPYSTPEFVVLTPEVVGEKYGAWLGGVVR